MCLSVPVKILEIKKNNKAVADFQGRKREVDFRLVRGVQKGDYGLVSSGFFIKKISAKEAEEIFTIIKPKEKE